MSPEFRGCTGRLASTLRGGLWSLQHQGDAKLRGVGSQSESKVTVLGLRNTGARRISQGLLKLPCVMADRDGEEAE